MRINKYLAGAGFGARRKCEELVQSGIVKVNGKTVKSLSFDINEKKDIVFVADKKASLCEFEYVMLHKPKGYVTTKSDEKGRKSVMSLLPEELQHLFPVGRLDFETEGLLLFTNDGNLAQNLTHPSKEISKTYHVKIEGNIKESELAVLRAGVVIDGKRTQRAKVSVVRKIKGFVTLSISIFEGRNRQIRKMMDAIGKTVVFLKRVAVDELKLGGLGRGKFRFLRQQEILLLKNLGVGGEN